jgi:phospholipid transport system substrate-binding protein
MKKMLLVIVGFCIFMQTLAANEQKILENHFLNKIEEVILIVKDKSLDKTTRNTHIINVLTPMFDFELMAKLSLGKVWNTLPLDTRKNFLSLYEERMQESYSSKIDVYSDEKISITEILQPKSNRIEVITNLVSKDDKLEISYKFYKPQNMKMNKDKWLIYDVVISGVSILKTDIAQFREFLQSKNIIELIAQLKLNAQ